MAVQFVTFMAVLAILCNLTAKCTVKATTKCGFTLNTNGYKNAPTDSVDYHDWVLVNGPSSAGELTGPKHGYSINTTGSVNPDENALLISPCYTHSKDDGNPQIKFFYNMYGRDIGSLNVHLRPGCVELSGVEVSSSTSSGSWETIQSVAGNQGNQWIDGQSVLATSSVNFQIIFEGISGNGTLDDIALDEITIDGVKCNQSHFFCDRIHCINDISVCNGIGDCLDGTDKDDCAQCSRSDLFLCSNVNRCIARDLTCNFYDDCGDGSDEHTCSDFTSLPISRMQTRGSTPDSSTVTSLLAQPTGDPLETDLIGTFTTAPTQNGIPTVRTSISSTFAEPTPSPNLIPTILAAVFGCLLFVLIVVNITYIVVKRPCRESPSDEPDMAYYITSIANQCPDTHMSTSNLNGTSDNPSNVIPNRTSDDPSNVIPLTNAGYQDLTIRPPESTYQGIYSDIP